MPTDGFGPDAKLYWQIFCLLGSAEGPAALEKLVTLREQKGWPSFPDIAERIENAVPLGVFQTTQAERDQWKQAYETTAANNATLKRNIAALRSTMWVITHWYDLRRIAFATCVGGLVIFGGLRLYQMLPPGPNAIAAARSADGADDRIFRSLLSETKWGEGETQPAVVRVGRTDYWVLISGQTDNSSHVDALDRPVERRCLRLFASPIVAHAGAYLTPQPHNLLGYVQWPLRAYECRLRGADGKTVASND